MFHRTGFEELNPLTGFDDSKGPAPYQMVPKGDVRTVRLRNATGVVVKSTNGNVAAVSDGTAGSSRTVVIRGAGVGTCFIQASRDGGVVANLKVSVKALRTLTITFYFVKDAGNRRTKRAQSCVTPMLGSVNRILTPQANISAVLHRIEELEVPMNFGRVLRSGGDTDEVFQLAQYIDPSANATVFFVPRVEDSRFTVDAVAGRSYARGVFLEDRVSGDDSLALTHELVHHILDWVVDPSPKIAHHYRGWRNRDMLMYTSTTGGKKLSAIQIEALNGSAEWLPVENN